MTPRALLTGSTAAQANAFVVTVLTCYLPRIPEKVAPSNP